MYRNYRELTFGDDDHFKLTNFYKICNILTTNDEAMLKSIDYVSGLLANETCGTLQDIVDRLLPNEHQNECTRYISVAKNFMKNQFKYQLMLEDDCCFHSLQYALCKEFPLRENTNDNACKFPFFLCDYMKSIINGDSMGMNDTNDNAAITEDGTSNVIEERTNTGATNDDAGIIEDGVSNEIEERTNAGPTNDTDAGIIEDGSDAIEERTNAGATNDDDAVTTEDGGTTNENTITEDGKTNDKDKALTEDGSDVIEERTNAGATTNDNDAITTEDGTKIVEERTTNDDVGIDTLNDDDNVDEDIHSSTNCSIISESVRNDAISVIDGIKDKFRLFLAHQARCQCQSVAISLLEDDIKELCVQSKGKQIKALIIMDFKMKFESKSSRETTVEHYGKRGIGWHGFAVIFYLLDTNGEPYKNIIYLDQILSDDNSQDALTVVALLEIMVSSLISELPYIKEAVITSDNASCYQNHFVTFMMAI